MGTLSTAERHIDMVNVPTLRVVISDDEPLSRDKLRLLLEREQDVEIVAECSGIEDTYKALETYHPDLLLLDIEMGGGSGFEVLRRLDANTAPIVIFATAYDNYALQAFDTCALDYLLKPFDQERLHRALERARAEAAKSAKETMNENLANLLSTANQSAREKRLIIKSGGRVVFIQLDEIDWIEAAANYVRLHVAGKNAYLFREAISRMADKLDDSEFIRIHRSFIVNVSRIKELQPCNNGEFMVLLRNGKVLPCSRFYRHALESLWKEPK